MRNLPSPAFIISSIVFQAFSGIFAKMAALSLQDITMMVYLTNVFYILSLFCLVLQAVVWQQALVHYPLSFLYPFMSLTNFVVLFASTILFHEGITSANILGLAFISGGITLFSHFSGGDS